MRENQFQASLIRELKNLVGNDGIVYDNDGGYLQGFPDITVYYRDRWAWLECKISATASIRPNQQYYIDLANRIGGFGRFIFPENKEEVLHELQCALQFGR